MLTVSRFVPQSQSCVTAAARAEAGASRENMTMTASARGTRRMVPGMSGDGHSAQRAYQAWSIPPERVRLYEAAIREGGILMMVEARSDEDARRIEQRWKAIGGREVSGG